MPICDMFSLGISFVVFFFLVFAISVTGFMAYDLASFVVDIIKEKRRGKKDEESDIYFYDRR